MGEVSKDEGNRHQVVTWFFELHAWQKKSATPATRAPGGWGALPDGNTQALTSLAYDVYTLLHCNALPDELIERLRDRHEFQGARYEIAVAAMFSRAGFKLSYVKSRGKHCEFVATHTGTGVEVGVEAKSRRRRGVLHEKGAVDPAAVLRGDVQKLFDAALQQKPDGLPFLIFIDINCPPDGDTPLPQKTWWEDLHACFETYDAIREGKEDPRDPYNAVIVTNFSAHYFADDHLPTTGERIMAKSTRPQDLLPDPVLMEVWTAVNRYGTFPRDPG